MKSKLKKYLVLCCIIISVSQQKIYSQDFVPRGEFCVDKLSRDFMDAVNRLRTQGTDSDVYKAL